MNSRYYNPEWGRYLNSDALGGSRGDLLSHNVFAYCKNNPVNMTDPNGYLSGWVKWALVAVAAVVVVAAIVAIASPATFAAAVTMGTAVLTRGAQALQRVAQRAVQVASRVSQSKGVRVANKGAGNANEAHNIAQFEKLRASYADDEIINAERTSTALSKSDPSHLSASFLTKEQLAAGKVTSFRGGDYIQRTLLQTKGELNGKAGIFEYILTPEGMVSHQRFITGGIFTGYPNQILR